MNKELIEYKIQKVLEQFGETIDPHGYYDGDYSSAIQSIFDIFELGVAPSIELRKNNELVNSQQEWLKEANKVDNKHMKIQEFEQRLKDIDPKFEIIQHPNNPELAGLYYDRNEANKTGFVVTVPANEIREEFDAGYADSTGHPHNWASKVTFVANEHLRRLKEEPDYKENFYAPIDWANAPRAK